MAIDFEYDGGLTCAIQVTSLEKAVQWYQDMMGMEVKYKLDDMGWCELTTAVPGVCVGLSQVEKPDVVGGATLTFGVKDIDIARKQLEDNDVRFDGDTMVLEGMVKLATFFDPDGNKLMFYQDY